MTDNAKKFLDEVQSDESLKSELEKFLKDRCTEEIMEAMVEFAEKNGFELEVRDFMPDGCELSEEELVAVAGGGACACGAVGGGGGDWLVCAYIIAGCGGVEGRHISQGGCLCCGSGAGATNRH